MSKKNWIKFESYLAEAQLLLQLLLWLSFQPEVTQRIPVCSSAHKCSVVLSDSRLKGSVFVRLSRERERVMDKQPRTSVCRVNKFKCPVIPLFFFFSFL